MDGWHLGGVSKTLMSCACTNIDGEPDIGAGGRFKNTCELLNLRALKNTMYKNHIFQCMGKIFCVESYPYIEICGFYSHMKNFRALRFKSSQVFLKRPSAPMSGSPLMLVQAHDFLVSSPAHYRWTKGVLPLKSSNVYRKIVYTVNSSWFICVHHCIGCPSGSSNLLVGYFVSNHYPHPCWRN